MASPLLQPVWRAGSRGRIEPAARRILAISAQSRLRLELAGRERQPVGRSEECPSRGESSPTTAAAVARDAPGPREPATCCSLAGSAQPGRQVAHLRAHQDIVKCRQPGASARATGSGRKWMGPRAQSTSGARRRRQNRTWRRPYLELAEFSSRRFSQFANCAAAAGRATSGSPGCLSSGQTTTPTTIHSNEQPALKRGGGRAATGCAGTGGIV